MSSEFRTDFGSYNEPEHVSRYGSRISERVALELLANGFDGFKQNPANIVFQIHGGLTLTYWRDGEYGDAWNLKDAEQGRRPDTTSSESAPTGSN